jgi:hypothetical protein
MVQRLLTLRADIFEDYSEEHFIAALHSVSQIVKIAHITESGRLLAWFQRG